MIQTYRELTKDEVQRAGKTFIFCDHEDVTPAVYKGAKFVTEDMVGTECPYRADRPGPAKGQPDMRLWQPEDVGVVQIDPGKLVSEEVVGKSCAASAEVTVEEREVTVGNFTGTERFAPLPEGWASTSENALDGAADFCPKHAYRIPDAPTE